MCEAAVLLFPVRQIDAFLVLRAYALLGALAPCDGDGDADCDADDDGYSCMMMTVMVMIMLVVVRRTLRLRPKIC